MPNQNISLVFRNNYDQNQIKYDVIYYRDRKSETFKNRFNDAASFLFT